jgi:hypothetical protein
MRTQSNNNYGRNNNHRGGRGENGGYGNQQHDSWRAQDRDDDGRFTSGHTDSENNSSRYQGRDNEGRFTSGNNKDRNGRHGSSFERHASYNQNSSGNGRDEMGGTSFGSGPNSSDDVTSGTRKRHAHDDDYHHWRDDQMKQLDNEYDAYRSDRRKKFSDDFSTWRDERKTSQGSTDSEKK